MKPRRPSARLARTWKGWDRLLWGVIFSTDHDADRTPGLLGTAWNDPARPAHYAGEPTRPLLFVSRRKAQAWCRDAAARAAKHSSGWHFVAVRVHDQQSAPTEIKAAPARGRKKRE